jgi:hypothetical protein
MILRTDHDPARLKLLYWMVRTMMTELHFYGGRATCQTQQLVSQADAKGWQLGINQFCNCFYCISARLRIARTIGKEKAIR